MWNGEERVARHIQRNITNVMKRQKRYQKGEKQTKVEAKQKY